LARVVTRLTTEILLRPGSTGDAVRDVQRRLAALGHDTSPDTPGVYGGGSAAAVLAFQQRRGLREDGLCGPQTWSSLVEAGYHLGDRLLYLHQPMLRGDDVGELQRDLGALGFDAGRVDAIFGPNTATALTSFQRNAGITTDGICGPDTIAALRRVVRVGSDTTVAHVREAETMRARRGVTGRRIAIGETGGLAALADTLGRALTDAGAVVVVLHHPDESVHAADANAFEAEAYLGLKVIETQAPMVAYYATDRFVSFGGQHLAKLVVEELAALPALDAAPPVGMRLPVLRETRMPAVLCEVGPPRAVVERSGELVQALRRACNRWGSEPADA
jgi:N-acetylmuramoyl-L-alanine amidase